MMVRALEVDDGLGPELSHDLDLLTDAPASRMEILVEGLVLDVVPADAHAEAQAPASQHVHRRSLLGHQRSLTLRQDHDARDQLQLLRAGAEEAEQDEHLMERTLVGIRRRAAELVESLELAAQHVVEDEQMMVAGALGGLRIVADHGGIRSALRLRKYHSELHAEVLLDRGMAHRSTGLSSITCRRRDAVAVTLWLVSYSKIAAWTAFWNRSVFVTGRFRCSRGDTLR